MLGQLGDGRAVEPLVAALRDEDESVRESAAEALGRLAAKLTEAQCRTAADRVWQEAIRSEQPDVYEPLLAVANRLVVLEVERLPTPEYPDV